LENLDALRSFLLKKCLSVPLKIKLSMDGEFAKIQLMVLPFMVLLKTTKLKVLVSIKVSIQPTMETLRMVCSMDLEKKYPQMLTAMKDILQTENLMGLDY